MKINNSIKKRHLCHALQFYIFVMYRNTVYFVLLYSTVSKGFAASTAACPVYFAAVAMQTSHPWN